jgi:flagellin
MIINHNMNAMNAHRSMMSNVGRAGKSMEKLSSGLRINRAGDDAAGLAISEKMRGQIRGLDQASRNAQDGISMIQTAEGALNETHSILQRMRELSVQSSNDSNNADDRAAVQKEVEQLKSEIDRIGNTTEFNTTKLIDGSIGAQKVAGLDNAAVIGKEIGVETAAKTATTTPTKALLETYVGTGGTIGVDGAKISFETKASDYTGLITSGDEVKTKELAAQMQKDINAGIDDYNAKNGTDVKHITVEHTGDLDGTIEIKSGSVGATSSIDLELDIVGNKTADFWQTVGANTGAATKKTLSTTGDEGLFTEAGAGAVNAISGLATKDSKALMTIDGKEISIDFSSGAAGAGGTRATNTFKTAATGMDKTHKLSELADELQADLNNAIKNYNDTASSENKVEEITVSVKDGAFVIQSGSEDATSSIKFDNSKVFDLIGVAGKSSATQGGGVDFQIGANSGQKMKVTVSDMRAAALGIDKIDMSTKEGAQDATTSLDDAIKSVSSQRAELGAFQNRLEHTIANLGTSSENLQSAESRIRDVDMAKEMMNFSKENILQQAAQAMLAQAKQAPQGVLQLLR